MTAATLVRPVLWLTYPAVQTAAQALWTEPRLRERYPVYLGAMYWLIRASVPLMEAAVDGCAALPAGDRSAAPLAEYFHAHIAEEQGHDRWLLEDLASLGVWQPDTLLGPAVRQDVAALAGAQYYWIRHVHPACLLAYMSVLEGCPPDPGLVARLPGLTGWPAPAFRTLASHAALDPGHEQEIVRLLDLLPLNAAVTEQLARNAAHTAVHAAALLRRLAGGTGVGPR